MRRFIWVLAALACLGDAARADDAPPPVALTSHAVPLSPTDPDLRQIGQLRYRGGIELRSPDERFGGLSGLWVSPDGSRAIAVSDRGHWVRFALQHAGDRLVGAEDLTITPLRAPDGKPVSGDWADAEGLTVSPSGLFVSFEREDRVLRYTDTAAGEAPHRVAMPAAVKDAAFNKGLEGLALLPSGKLLALTERTLAARGLIRGWIVDLADPARAKDVRLVERDGFSLTDLALLPDGDVLTLERRFSRAAGTAMQVRRLAAAKIRPGAKLDGPVLARLSVEHTIDNMEGLAVRQDAAGRVHLYVVSDDNFRIFQRTLLMHFVLIETDPA
jgi:hypothetical protein